MRITDLPLILDVKEEYIQLRKEGKNRIEAVDKLMQNYSDEITIGAEDDGLQFWVGLADGQFYRKELSQEVAEKALEALAGIEQTDWEVTPGDITRRRNNYSTAPMPERKVGKPRPKFQCKWAIGDTYAYHLTGQKAYDAGIGGKYALLRKVDNIDFNSGHILPVVTVTLWDEKPFPTTTEEFNKVPLVILWKGRCGWPGEDVEYRAEIVFKNQKQVSGLSLEYVGNFGVENIPDDEVVIDNAGSIIMLIPEVFEKDICIHWKKNCFYRSHP